MKGFTTHGRLMAFLFAAVFSFFTIQTQAAEPGADEAAAVVLNQYGFWHDGDGANFLQAVASGARGDFRQNTTIDDVVTSVEANAGATRTITLTVTDADGNAMTALDWQTPTSWTISDSGSGVFNPAYSVAPKPTFTDGVATADFATSASAGNSWHEGDTITIAIPAIYLYGQQMAAPTDLVLTLSDAGSQAGGVAVAPTLGGVGSGMVDLTTDVTGDLPFANLTQGSARSVLGVTGASTADNASIAASSDNQVLRRSGTSIGFGAVALNQSAAITGALPIANGGTGTTDLLSLSTSVGSQDDVVASGTLRGAALKIDAQEWGAIITTRGSFDSGTSSDTTTAAACTGNSEVMVMPLSTTRAPLGRWVVSPGAGSFAVYSFDEADGTTPVTETEAIAFMYVIFE